MPITVALLGGESGSRTTLARALRQSPALQAPEVQVVIDATPALAEQNRYDLTLLLALEPSDSALCEAADAQLRDSLQSAGLAFQIVHGQGTARVQQALRAIGRLMGQSLVVEDPALTTGRGRWTCDNCSDPDCEHRLFTGLLSRP
jgi:HTH-type transcriptional repressor of NAD biosynthesis genes